MVDGGTTRPEGFLAKVGEQAVRIKLRDAAEGRGYRVLHPT